MTLNSVEHITDMVMSELKSRNTTNNGSVDHLAGLFDRGREMAGYDRKNVSKEDLKKQVLKLEKNVHELEQANKKQESFVYELSIKNRDLRDEKEDLKKQVLKLEKDVHELEQANKKQESFVYEVSKKNHDLRDEKHANKKQVNELLKEIYKPDALQKLVDDLKRRLKQDA